MLTISHAVSVTTNEHRAAWDATISAPKSVSLAALVGGDGRIRDAHRESINETVKELEKYVQARALKKGKARTKTKPKQRRRRAR
jgi:conjugative relaxase-like TrwC/TraI family protein